MRLLPTLILLGAALVAIFGLWYPDGYAGLSKLGLPVAVLAGVAVVVGPGLTALVYRPGKPGLAMDLAILAGLELIAVGLMTARLHARQPTWLVFAVDRFEVVTRQEVDPDAFREPQLARRPGHRPRLVYAEMPTDPEVFDRLLDETVLLGLPDIDRRPEFWRRYPAGIARVRAAARPLSDLLDAPGPGREEAAAWLAETGAAAADYLFLPVRGQRADGAMLVHARSGYPVAILPVDPWQPASAAQDGPPARDVEQAHQ